MNALIFKNYTMMKTSRILSTATLISLLSFPVLAQDIDLSLQSDSAEPDPDPLLIPLDPDLAVSIDPVTGNITATAEPGFLCGGDCQVSLQSADGGSFTVNGGSSVTVPENGSVRFDWQARGAWTCSGTLRDSTGAVLSQTAWPGSGKLPFGTQPVTLTNLLPGVYTAGLNCSNSGVIASAPPVTIEVLTSGLEIPTECQGRQPGGSSPSNFCWYRNGSVNCYKYSQVFGTFPGTQNSIEFEQLENTYTAMEFSTDSLSRLSGGWNFDTPQPGYAPSGPKIMTISRCPGDFDRDLIEQEMGSNCYKKVENLTNLLWELDDGSSSAFRCQLQRNETYFLNIIYSTDPAGTEPAQLEWGCGPSTSASNCGNLMSPN